MTPTRKTSSQKVDFKETVRILVERCSTFSGSGLPDVSQMSQPRGEGAAGTFINSLGPHDHDWISEGHPVSRSHDWNCLFGGAVSRFTTRIALLVVLSHDSRLGCLGVLAGSGFEARKPRQAMTATSSRPRAPIHDAMTPRPLHHVTIHEATTPRLSTTVTIHD